jgi:REP element-mobilizing transposase RayT
MIFSAYGFWLPNDERVSGSDYVRAHHIYKAGGGATKVRTTHSVATRPFSQEERRASKAALKYPAVILTGVQAQAAALGIGKVCLKVQIAVHACAIMPDHVYVVLAARWFSGDELITCLKKAATRGMNEAGMHPMREFARANGRLPSPWAARGWKVRLNTAEQVRTAIRYVEMNPVRAGFKRQSWSFVGPYIC